MPAAMPPAAEPFGCVTTGPGDPALAEAPGAAAPALDAADARRASEVADGPLASGSGGGRGPGAGGAGSDWPRRKLRDLSVCPPVRACVDVLVASTLTLRIGGGGRGRARSVSEIPAVIGRLSRLVELVVEVAPERCLRLCLRV